MGMREGTIVRWLKAEGDAVAEDEALAVIEAEKVEDSLYSTDNGILQRIIVPEGSTVLVGTVLAMLNEPG
jgi:pyruvate/2-oxoglutarate dehydrogenase complex dihydrolipoamide acyltransferase (E2) component